MYYCGNSETAFHIFLDCPLFTVIGNEIQMDTMFLPNRLLNVILNGDIDSSAQGDIEIDSAVSKYTIKTNCFLKNILNVQ